ncbi:MAG: S8 family serine peptidase [candidate division WS1 bacterium]|jgi:subtilisin family serine protease|nr:S8 family serine peptidase [candidate division WS1 bacterium]
MKKSNVRQTLGNIRLLTLVATLLCLLMAGSILSAAWAQGAGGGEGRYLVRFRQGLRAQDASLLRSENAQIHRRFHIVPAVAARMSPQAAARLAANPRVAYVEPDFKVRALAQEVPWGISRIGAPMVHSGGNTGSGVKVAIIDTGIDYTHPDLAANYAGGYDFVNGDSDPMDDQGHGTHCAGTVAAVDNSEGVIGVAPGASLYGLKMLNANGEGSLSDGIAAIEWCVDNGIDIASMSWGAYDEPISETLRDCLRECLRQRRAARCRRRQ